VDKVKEAGGKPFVTDTTSLYRGGRFTASECLETAKVNGFTTETLGAPLIIADGENGDKGVSIGTEGRIGKIEVAKAIANADAMIMAVHAKGHRLCGFGGAVKGLGMGCTTKKSKSKQHHANVPILDSSKCDGCGLCVKSCPYKLLTLEKGRVKFNKTLCSGCLECYFMCPKKALSLPTNSSRALQENLAEAASAVLKIFKEGKIAYFSFLMDVTPYCDCEKLPGNPFIPDLGILASFDPVAIDWAAVDLINEAKPISDTLLKGDKLKTLTGVDYSIQLKMAEKFKMGSKDYQLIKV
jgi:uncharacterized Fe-S center protein